MYTFLSPGLFPVCLSLCLSRKLSAKNPHFFFSLQAQALFLSHCRLPLGVYSAQARGLFPSLSSPFPLPPFPFTKPVSGRAQSAEDTGRWIGETLFPLPKIMYQPSRGAARRLRRCLRAYQARPQDQYPQAPPFLPLWLTSPTITPPSASPHLRLPLLSFPPSQLFPQVPQQPLPQAQAFISPWMGLPSGKGEDEPGPGLHGGCLDGLRSLFEELPCPHPGALIPFRAPGSPHPAPATSSGNPSMEEHLAVMHEKLRQELPNLFLRSHDYNLYSSDVEFINEILNIRTKGRTWYILSLTLCRFLAWNYFAQLQLEVLRLSQHPEDWTLQARWRLVGLPTHLLFLRFYRRDKDELYRTYDAYSTFYLNSEGLIYRHRLDKISLP
ncbi:uncharacterized protein C6orf136 homolog isoform X2 [Sarcophilus harrisii]|uniref:uncharacterized protein C6orf136 homolog isoform X2 n=1 Tax=Sarcophilus harrisii TaxID=9305 RepID=UPI001301D0B6|nr:uncharacterized protein C6orf136 homolog isoform X2 [Sarcophilus harrisii]